jgi:hypothetical protein
MHVGHWVFQHRASLTLRKIKPPAKEISELLETQPSAHCGTDGAANLERTSLQCSRSGESTGDKGQGCRRRNKPNLIEPERVAKISQIASHPSFELILNFLHLVGALHFPQNVEVILHSIQEIMSESRILLVYPEPHQVL